MINIQKTATQKLCSKKVQHEKSSTCKKCNLIKKRKTGRPLTDLYTLVNRKE